MNKNKRVVLLGYIGAGKTSLFNLITQSNEKTKEGGKSVTQRVLIGYSQHLKGFEILDTPGFSLEETMESLSGVLAGLYYGDINRILMVVKYERVKQMMGFIKKMFKKIKDLKDVITVVVTQWDKCDVQNMVNEECLIKKSIEATGINSVIFCSNPMETRTQEQSSIIICAQIEQALQQNNQVLTFKATKKVLANLSTPDYVDQEKIDLAGTEIKVDFRKIALCYIKFINDFDYTDLDALDVMHYLQLNIKSIADKKVDEYIQKYGEQLNEKFDLYSENKQYLLFIKLKQNITKDYQNVISEVQSKMNKFNIYSHSWIKRCPNCKRIWIKVSGCEGLTYCGNRMDENDLDYQNSKRFNTFKKYLFIIQNNLLKCEKQQIEQCWDAKQVISSFAVGNNLITANVIDEAYQIIYSQLKSFQENILSKIEAINQKNLQIQQCQEQTKMNNLLQERDKLIFKFIGDYNKILWNEDEKMNQLEIVALFGQFRNKESNPIYQKSDFLNLNISKWIEKMDRLNKPNYLSAIQQILQSGQINNENNKHYEGCNFQFQWDEQPPISENELKAIFSPDLFDYLTDKVKLERDEYASFQQELIDTLNMAIIEKLKSVELQTKQ